MNPAAYVAGGFAPPYEGDLRREFEGQARMLADCGVDFLLPEYMGGDTSFEGALRDCVTAVDVCAETGLPVFLGICNITDEGKLLHNETFPELVEALEGHPVEGIFLMCSYPWAISAAMPRLRDALDGPIGGYAHLGYHKTPRVGAPGEPYYLIGQLGFTPEKYAETARQWKEVGAQVIGGCCATGPEHIDALRKAL